ncbi:unnamed protein product, partial [Heterosigma akashiwo]
GYLHQSFLYQWPALQNYSASNHAMEAIHIALLRHFPEISEMFKAAFNDRDRHFQDQVDKLLEATGGSNAALAE